MFIEIDPTIMFFVTFLVYQYIYIVLQSVSASGKVYNTEPKKLYLSHVYLLYSFIYGNIDHYSNMLDSVSSLQHWARVVLILWHCFEFE